MTEKPDKHPPTEPAAVVLACDLLKWIIPKVGKFPRNVRYGLGSRIEAAHLDVLRSLCFRIDPLGYLTKPHA